MQNKKILILIIFFLFIASLYCFDFQRGGIRNYSLGRTGTASTNDLSASAYNPSLLSKINSFGILTDSRLYGYQFENDEWNYNYLCIGIPLGSLGSFALSGDIFGANIYSENRVGLHWGESYFSDRVSFGTSLNYYFIEYKENEYTHYDPFFNHEKNKQGSFDFDIGLAYDINTRLRIAFLVNNILQSDLAIESDNNARLDRFFNFGVNYNINENWSIMGDLGVKQDDSLSENYLNYALGSEYNILDVCDLRAGMNNNDITFGLGIKILDRDFVSTYNNILSSEKMIETKSLLIEIDYAFSYPIFSELESQIGNHFLGLQFSFNSDSNSEEELKKHIEPRIKRRIIKTATRDSLSQYAVPVRIDTIYVDRIIKDTLIIRDTVEVEIGVPQNEYERKVNELNIAVKKVKQFKTNNQALIHVMEATKYYYLGEYDVAIEHCNTAIKLAPDMALAYIKLGSLYYRKGKADLAWKNWKEAKRLDPKNPELKQIFK